MSSLMVNQILIQKPSALGRRSYIDDILIPATSWKALYEKVERLLEVCDKWNLSISLAKRFWERLKIEYLGHQILLARLEANPKDLRWLLNIPFTRTLRAMQSFLGGLNYYSRFIEDFAVYESVLYELREADFHEINRVSEAPKPTSAVRPDSIHEGSAEGDRDLYPKPEIDVDRYPIAGDDRDPEGRNQWEKAMIVFTLLNAKIANSNLKAFRSQSIACDRGVC